MTVKVVVPDWVVHRADDRSKRTTVYSLAAHPDGSRLATGGLDTKIRIWATSPMLHEKESERPDCDRLLCTLARHTGAVLVVRWSHSGRFLASGSDDTVALIWELDPSGMGTGLAFGSTERNVEHWRPHRRLPGHESDVTDLAWSEQDEYLATVGLDSLVMIWSGDTFERLRTIQGHQGFVKGVAFDPVDQFLATASDDKTVKIWRTSDWGLEKSVSEPFRTSPSSSFFRRPAWSPDGANLLTANAMNGPVFVSTAIKRLAWSFDTSLVGHENAVVVVAFSPRLFRGVNGQEVSTVVALGSQDQSVSVWITGLPRPVLVARDVFERHVMDLSWSADGYTLYACSSDGSIALFTFTPDELAETLPDTTLTQARESYGFVRKTRATHAPQAALPMRAGTAERPRMLTARKGKAPRPPAPPARLTQQITINKDGKRRIRPTLLDADGLPTETLDTADSSHNRKLPTLDDDPVPLAKLQRADGQLGRTLGGDLDRGRSGPSRALGVPLAANGAPLCIEPPTVLSVLRQACADVTVEARNHEPDSGVSEMSLLDGAGRVLWLDYVAFPVVLATATRAFVAVALSDGSLVWYSRRGRRLATLQLDAPCAQLQGEGVHLAAVTCASELVHWDVLAEREVHRAVRLPCGGEQLHLFKLINGVAALVVGQQAFAFDPRKMAFVCICSAWHLQHSECWDARHGAGAGREPVGYIEGEVNALITRNDPDATDAMHRTVATIRHLETRMAAAALLDSPAEYRQALHALAKKLADERLEAQAEDLIRMLLGPLY